MLFCGIDLHSNNSVVVISDENDKAPYSKSRSVGECGGSGLTFDMFSTNQRGQHHIPFENLM
jgi:hypothetical protein